MSSLVAQQQINSSYDALTGAAAKKRVIAVIMIMAFFAALLSIMGSSYGLYYDMVLDYGHYFALVVSILGGIFIEGVKYVAIAMFFAWGKNILVRGLGIGLLIFIMPIAIALHYKGADNMQRTKIIEIVDAVQKRNAQLQSQEQNRKNKIVEIANSVLNNGTIADDAIAMKTLSSIDNYSNSLLSHGKISKIDAMQIEEVKKASKKRAESLKVILPLLEVLSIFGMIGALLKSLSVSPSIKRIVEKKQAHEEIDAVVEYLNNPAPQNEIFVDAILRKMDKAHQDRHSIETSEILNDPLPELPISTKPKIDNSPTLSERQRVITVYDRNNDPYLLYRNHLVYANPQDNIIYDLVVTKLNEPIRDGFDPYIVTNPRLFSFYIDSDYCVDEFMQKVDDKLAQTSLQTSQETSSQKNEQTPKNRHESSFETSSKSSPKSLNLMTFGAVDREIITALWKQGDVQVDDKLASRSVVTRETGIKMNKYSAFMNELENKGYAYNVQGKGWYASVPLKNKVSIE